MSVGLGQQKYFRNFMTKMMIMLLDSSIGTSHLRTGTNFTYLRPALVVGLHRFDVLSHTVLSNPRHDSLSSITVLIIVIQKSLEKRILPYPNQAPLTLTSALEESMSTARRSRKSIRRFFTPNASWLCRNFDRRVFQHPRATWTNPLGYAASSNEMIGCVNGCVLLFLVSMAVGSALI
jgi:hypothetical protein